MEHILETEIGVVCTDIADPSRGAPQYHVASSPYMVLVQEPYRVQVSGEPQTEPILSPVTAEEKRKYSYVTILTNDAFCRCVCVWRAHSIENTFYREHIL